MKKIKKSSSVCCKKLKEFSQSNYFLPSILLLIIIILALITVSGVQKTIRERLKAGGGCFTAGKTVPSDMPTDPSPCCAGLDLIHSVFPDEQGACPTITDTTDTTTLALCSNCGNGACEPWENHCNCSQDCSGQRMLGLKIKFQCINQKPAKDSPQRVKVKIAPQSGQSVEIPNTYFYPLNNGFYFSVIYPEETLLDSTATSAIYVKGPKHLQRKFDNLTLTAGQTLDLTTKILEAGDLPTQDGKVDRSDYDTLVSKISEPYSENYDLNMDGGINMVDVSCLIDTLSVKYEEE